MAETDLTEPTTIDRDTMLVGLTAIGIRLYADSGEVLADSVLAAERVVFARQFVTPNKPTTSGRQANHPRVTTANLA